MNRTDRALAVLVLGLTCITASCSEDPIPTCGGTDECPQGEACLSQICQTISCATTLDCPGDAICYDETRRCGQPECETEVDCFNDRQAPFCVAGRCVEALPTDCHERSECGDGETCRSETCVGVGTGLACIDDESCGNPQICDRLASESGTCFTPCTDNANCDQFDDLRACDQTAGLCYPVECLRSNDCEDGFQCNDDDVCVVTPRDCDVMSCADIEGRPLQTTPADDLCSCVQCFEDANCAEAAGELCAPSQRCLYCPEQAAAASGCPPETPYFREGCCLACVEDGQCDDLGVGSRCTNGRCVACDCAAGCPCPTGMACDIDDDGAGQCEERLGGVGDTCRQQDQCREDLACSYASGTCVASGSDDLCSAGCPAPSRCAQVAGESALCYGCHSDRECPGGQACVVPDEWEGVFDGGRCLPEL